MILHFLGAGGAFARTHTNAWFEQERPDGRRDLYLLDLSMLHAQAAEELVREDTGEIRILLTHMHDDHCSGIGVFAEWCWFLRKRVVNIAVHAALEQDVRDYMRIIGVTEEMYRLIVLPEQEEMAGIPLTAIPTRHTPALEGKCFGFCLETAGGRVVYTGDTATLEPFLPYLSDGAELYTEISYHHGLVHLLWEEQKKLLLPLAKKCSVFLMHMDDEAALRRETEGSGIRLVTDVQEQENAGAV